MPLANGGSSEERRAMRSWKNLVQGHDENGLDRVGARSFSFARGELKINVPA
jgi:hypothetical protein